MSKKTKTWLTIAASLVLVGCVCFGCVMTMLQWDFTKLSTAQYETNEHQINEDYHGISIITNTADILFEPSENETGKVVCFEQKNTNHTVTVKDDTLVIEVVDARKWYEHISIGIGSPQITVYIPRGEYDTLSLKTDTGKVEIPDAFQFANVDVAVNTGDVKCMASASETIKIKSSTGDIRAENISANAMDLSVSTGEITAENITCQGDMTVNVSTGRVKLTDITCKNITSGGSTGDISMKNVIATQKLSAERSTGSIQLDGCDGGEIFIRTDTGDVSGTLLSEKVFITETSTGKISVPKTTSGGKCEITTSTGDIRIEVP